MLSRSVSASDSEVEPMTALNPVFTVAQQIGEVLRIHQGLNRKAARRNSLELLQKVHIPDPNARLDSYPHELSGGQQQRVALARALASEPAMLLLDEPFASLDSELRRTLRRELRAMLAQSPVPVMLVTHDREEALASSDRIAVMGDNSIEQIGTPEDVYQNPVSASVAKLIGPCELIPGIFREGQVDTETGTFPARMPKDVSVAEGQQVLALMRASELEIEVADDSDSSRASIELREFEGEFVDHGEVLDVQLVEHGLASR